MRFGRKLKGAASIEECLILEAEGGRAEAFDLLDALTGELLAAALDGTHIAELVEDKVRGAKASLPTLGGAGRCHFNALFAPGGQQGRGAWYLPDSVSVKVGLVNLVAHFRDQPRFAMGIASEETANVSLISSPDAGCLWALLEPFFNLLWLPLQIRSSLLGTLGPEEFQKRWQQARTFYQTVGFRCENELQGLGYGRGWHKFTAAEQTDRKLALIGSVRTNCPIHVGARFRLYRIRHLVERYYSKANAVGQAERRIVLTKGYQAILSGVFAGDWIAFLKYLGEAPHPNEQVETTLPATRLYLTDTKKVTEIAGLQNVPLAEVERMVAAFWERQGAPISPIEERIGVLRRYWKAFDRIHADQKAGGPSLWGLIGTRGMFIVDGRDDGPYRANLCREWLPLSFVSEIESLWSGTTLPTHPEVVVTELFPHAAMAEAFGPAVTFWHGCALTAWFIAEGPTSRTDMAGLEHYHRRDMAALEDLGCSVDPMLFRHLIEVEATLGQPQPIEQERCPAQSSTGISITMTMTVGSRGGGFEKLRDAITQYRAAWAANNLEKYLRCRWNGSSER